MKTLFALINRNRKLFFRDKGMLFSSLITPIILIVLYGTFLQNVYKQSFESALPKFMSISEELINGTVAGQLAAALLAVSCVTVTFCVNLTMIQDRANGSRKDLNVAPVKKPMIYMGYFFSTVLNSLMVNILALAICLAYVKKMGWFLTAGDVALMVLDIIVLVLFGTVLSSIVCYPLKTQGQMSAVGTIVSAGYGFICGAYMPISSFSEGLQKVVSLLPGTYGTSLLRNHALRGVFEEMEVQGFPTQVVEAIKDSVDCNLYFFGEKVGLGNMYVVLIASIIIAIGLYVGMNMLLGKRRR